MTDTTILSPGEIKAIRANVGHVPIEVEMITRLCDTVDELRRVAGEIGSLLRELPRTATAEAIDKRIRAIVGDPT